MMVARHAQDDTAEPDTAAPPRSQDRTRLSVTTAVLFAVGVALLIAAALSLTHLSEWAERWGQVPVFLVFFIVMSLAGRWFWGGIDAFVAAIKGR